MAKSICSVEGCPRTVKAYGFCQFHHRRLQRWGDPRKARATPEERFWSRVAITPSCWLWTGTVGSHGYGVIKIGGRAGPVLLTHRVVYEWLVGPIPDGLTIDHLCRRTLCCNPQHLEAVSTRTNTLRGTSPSAINARKTHCKGGHEFTPENTYLSKKGHRTCKTCHVAWLKASRQRS